MKTTSKKVQQIKVSHRLAVAEIEERKGNFSSYDFYKELEEIGGGTVIFTGPKAERDALKYLQGLRKNKSVIDSLHPGKCIKLTVAVNSELPPMYCQLLPALPLPALPCFVPAAAEELAEVEQLAEVAAPAKPKRVRTAKVIKLPEVKPAATAWQIAI